MSARPVVLGGALTPGKNVDKVDVNAGILMFEQTGGGSPEEREVIRYALQRWARGEEAAAERTATDRTFYGTSMTRWRMILAAAVASDV